MSRWEARCKGLQGATVGNGNGYPDDDHADKQQSDLHPVRIGHGKKAACCGVDDDDGTSQQQR